MAEGNGNGNGRAGSILQSLLTSVLIPAAATFLTFFGFYTSQRDQIFTAIERNRAEMRAEMRQELTHYPTLEAWLKAQNEDRVRSDAQYYSLKASIDHLTNVANRLERR